MLGASKRRIKIKFKLGRSPIPPPGRVHADKRKPVRSKQRQELQKELDL